MRISCATDTDSGVNARCSGSWESAAATAAEAAAPTRSDQLEPHKHRPARPAPPLRPCSGSGPHPPHPSRNIHRCAAAAASEHPESLPAAARCDATQGRASWSPRCSRSPSRIPLRRRTRTDRCASGASARVFVANSRRAGETQTRRFYFPSPSPPSSAAGRILQCAPAGPPVERSRY